MEVNEKELTEDIKVVCVQAEFFREGIPGAFEKLAQIPGGLQDRHVYGVSECMGDKMVYRACVAENFDGEAAAYGLETYLIPKGIYFYTTLKNWAQNIGQVPTLFEGFMQTPNVKKQTICLEDYTKEGDMLAMVQKA